MLPSKLLPHTPMWWASDRDRTGLVLHLARVTVITDQRHVDGRVMVRSTRSGTAYAAKLTDLFTSLKEIH